MFLSHGTTLKQCAKRQMIKILITEVSDSGISAQLQKGEPEIGQAYFLEDASHGTSAQNRMFHLLIDEWEKSGTHSFTGNLRDQVKLRYGEGFEAYLYWDGLKIAKVESKDEVPKDARETPGLCFGKLKSWADYTLKQRKKTIDTLISKMIESGVNSKRFNEIVAEYTDR